MSHRQQNYKTRGRGGAFQRLGVPVHSDGNNYQRGGGVSYHQRGGGGRGNFRGGRRNFRQPGASTRGFAFQQKGQIDRHSQKTWFKVAILRGAEVGKEFLLKSLGDYLDRPVWPVLYKTTEEGNATFFVDDKEVADAIGATSRRLQAPNGQKLNVRVTPNAAPYVPLYREEEEAVKTALQSRYDVLNQQLDLSAFQFDPTFQQDNRNMSLQRNNVMMAVVDLIGNEQQIANSIRSVDASGNRVRFMDYFACLVPRIPNVKRLILHHNQIDSMLELKKLSGWDLHELDLSQTPLNVNFRDKATYTKEIRDIFTNLTKLDGTELGPATKFGLRLTDVEQSTIATSSLPQFKPSFFVDDSIKGLTLQFIELYYTLFDSEDRNQRQKLLEAYDDDATFTMSAINLSSDAHNIRGDNWHEITRESHNILKMELWERFRGKLIQKGKLAILSYLCNVFPPSSHVPESFVVDISFASGNILCVNVSGVFRDRNDTTVIDQELFPLRYFNRVFLLLRNEKGLCIVNEMLFLSTLTPSQYANYTRQVERATPLTVQDATPMASSIADSTPGPSMVIPKSEFDPKLQLIDQFMKESGMKVEWAKKCLEDHDYDYAKAATAFHQFKLTGMIPAEAFQ